jgi:hypothetical protein
MALKQDGTVVAWGYNVAGQTNVPAGLSNVIAISAGYYHNMALRSNGTIVAWGENGHAQTIVPAGLSNVIAISAGAYHSMALSDIFDQTSPTIDCGIVDGIWHGTDVKIACTASDSGSGLANPTTDASFSLSTNVANGEEVINAVTDSRTVCDLAGNCATAGPISGNMVDKKVPSISILAPITDGIYTLNQAIAASYNCNDGGSGVATCVGPVVNGANFDTSTVGTKSFEVTTTDYAGNIKSQSLTYEVGTTIPTPTADVTFKVTDSATGRTIEKAKVSMDGVIIVTNDHGIAVYKKVAFGMHNYYVTKEKYLKATGRINVIGKITVNVKLKKSGTKDN